MIVIADTSPLNYLVLIGEADILQRLYGRVVIPEGVLRELLHPETPTVVSEWIARRPAWLEVERITTSPDPNLQWLGEGECEAIMLAEQHGQDVLLLMDEGRGRREAQRRRLRITGTLGVLNDAASRGWVDLSSAFERLRQTTRQVWTSPP
jgi:predicted nucleic acid-binding protein